MAQAGAIRAGKAYVEVGTDDSPLKRGLVAAGARLKGWGTSINTMGAAVGQKLTAFGSSVFSGLKSAATMVGIGGAAVVGGLFATAKLLADAETALPPDQARAQKELRESFAQLDGSIRRTAYSIASAFQPAVSAIIDIVRLLMQQIRQWIDAHPELIQGVNDFIGGIRDALSAGDLKLAGEILWAGLKVAWQSGVVALMKPWTDWKTSFQQTAIDAFYGVLEVANNVWASMRQAVASIAGFIKQAFLSALQFVTEKFFDTQVWLGKMTPQEAAFAKAGAGAAFGVASTVSAQETEADKKRIEKERRDKEDFLSQANLDANDAIAKANREEYDAAVRDLEALKGQLQGLQKQAKDKAVALPDEKLLERKLSVTGTFSSAAAARIGGATDPTKKVAENTAKALDKQDRVIKLLEDLPDNLRFGFFA